jgi:hypothetical protein
MSSVFSRWLVSSGSVAAVVAVAACGGGGQSHSTGQSTGATVAATPTTEVSTPSTTPSGIVAQIGHSVITTAAFDHWLGIELQTAHAVLVPPSFSSCVARAKASGANPTSSSSQKPPSAEELRRACAQRYQLLREEALELLIVDYWVIGAARELGVDETPKMIAHELVVLKTTYYPTEAKFRAFLASTRQTVADVLLDKHVDYDGEAIRAAIRKSVGVVNAARVARYYDEHKSSTYLIKQQRDVEIAAMGSVAEAMKVKREIQAGRSFESIAKTLKGPQPFRAEGGTVLGLEPGLYKQTNLNDAIFTAKPGVLVGPIKTTLGYYVLRVKAIHPPRQIPLSQVAATINASLPTELYDSALAAFVERWRAAWLGKTSCSPGYVVRKCKQFKATTPSLPENPLALY